MDIGEKAIALPFTGDLGGLINVFADDRHWSGDGRDELEEEEEKKRKLAEERRRKLKEDCIERIANVTAAGIKQDENYEINIEKQLKDEYVNRTKAQSEALAEMIQNYTTNWTEASENRNKAREAY